MEALLLAFLSIATVQPEVSTIHGNNEDAGNRQVTSGADRRHRVPLLDLFVTDIRESWIKGLEIFLLASLIKLQFLKRKLHFSPLP